MKKVFLGIIVIQYSLVAEVFETQDDLQGWTELRHSMKTLKSTFKGNFSIGPITWLKLPMV